MSSLLRGLVVFLMMFSTITYADVNNDVTFTLKSDGTIVSTTNIGVFDSAGDTLSVSSGSMPAEFKDSRTYSDNFLSYMLISRVGHYVRSINSVSGFSLTIPLKLKSFSGKGPSVSVISKQNCGSGFNYIIVAGDKPYELTNCRSNRANLSQNPGTSIFEASEIIFNFFEGEGVVNSLKKYKLPPGTWTFPSVIYTFNNPNSPITSSYNWVFNIKVVVEPSMAEVNMPSVLMMNVVRSSSGDLLGQGSVPVMVSGSLGRSLRVQTHSTGVGSLSKGAMQIPYNLVIQPQSGDTTRHNLINNGIVKPEVIIPLHGSLFNYILRLDANFIADSNNLSSGRFNDNVTLIFSTTDVP